jgi:hypothetical protein
VFQHQALFDQRQSQIHELAPSATLPKGSKPGSRGPKACTGRCRKSASRLWPSPRLQLLTQHMFKDIICPAQRRMFLQGELKTFCLERSIFLKASTRTTPTASASGDKPWPLSQGEPIRWKTKSSLHVRGMPAARRGQRHGTTSESEYLDRRPVVRTSIPLGKRPR